MLPGIGDLVRALHRGEFVAALARMEFRGVPIDPVTYPRLADKHAWAYARDALVPSINKAYRIFVKGQRRRLAFRHGAFPGLPRSQGDSLAAHG